MSGESDAIEDKAIEVVARAVSETPLQKAMASALCRHAGNALAKVAGHEDAARIHSQAAGQHTRKAGHKPGLRRR